MFYSMIGMYAGMYYNIMSSNQDDEDSDSSVGITSHSIPENNIISCNSLWAGAGWTDSRDFYKQEEKIK